MLAKGEGAWQKIGSVFPWHTDYIEFLVNMTLKTSYTYCSDDIMSTMESQITSLTIVYLTVYSGADQRKHKISASLACVRGIHRPPVNYLHKGPVTRKIFQFDDVIMCVIVLPLPVSRCPPPVAADAQRRLAAVIVDKTPSTNPQWSLFVDIRSHHNTALPDLRNWTLIYPTKYKYNYIALGKFYLTDTHLDPDSI